MRIDHISSRAAMYGIEGETVDGNDVEVVYRAATEAVRKIRETRQPFLLETFTYRQRGHFEPDDQAYVDKTELAEWTAKDPIDRLTKGLLSQGRLSKADIHAMQERVRATVAKAVEFASNSPFPDPSELTTDVYA
jgi:pyruvate dehydrogenase E1 component alpha subunit